MPFAALNLAVAFVMSQVGRKGGGDRLVFFLQRQEHLEKLCAFIVRCKGVSVKIALFCSLNKKFLRKSLRGRGWLKSL